MLILSSALTHEASKPFYVITVGAFSWDVLLQALILNSCD